MTARGPDGRFISTGGRRTSRPAKRPTWTPPKTSLDQQTGAYVPPLPAETSYDRSTTLVIYLIDRSGSMKGSEQAVVSGFNEYIQGLRQDAGDDVLLSLFMFDSSGTHRRNLMSPISSVRDMLHSEFRPGAMTPLHDAIANAILEHDRIIQKDRLTVNKILMVIHTDGLENASHEWKNRVHTLITERERTGFWTFVYMGSDIRAKEEAYRMGIPVGNTYQYHPAKIGATFGAASIDTLAYRGAKAAQTNVFFQAGVKIADGVTVAPKKRHKHLSSDAYTEYTTTEWADGTWSCNCPGWANRKSCKHIGGGVSAMSTGR